MFKHIISELLSGNGSILDNDEFKSKLNDELIRLSVLKELSESDIEELGDILHIGNIVYNNLPLDDDKQVIDNGVYDILLEKYRVYRVPQVGAEPVIFKSYPSVYYESSKKAIPIITKLDDKELLFEDTFYGFPIVTKQDLITPLVTFSGYESGKKYRVKSHGNPTLVGTLDKCKSVLCNDVDEEILKDPSYKVLERDFFGEHFKKGIINTDMMLKMMLEFKYDGLSVVVTVRNSMVVSAVSRGDTGMDKATDLTPIMYGYRFPRLPKLDIDIDVKCEAVMTYADLYYYNLERQKDYKNCRSAIIGLFSSNEGYKYQKYVTLIPLAVAPTDPNSDKWEPMNRCEEVEFLNKYLSSHKEYLRSSYVEGNYFDILFMIRKFVDEAEYVRPIMPTMYDGVVVSYVNEDIREKLGRENFINKYSVAVKFNTMKKMTELLAITYTVGQNGVVTPMAHYAPVEFLGTIHTKSSISSVKRFNENQFKIGNIIQVEYRNDVMPYVSTPELDVNHDNPNPVLEFIHECPECGHKLEFSKTLKSAKCPNLNCPGRGVARMAAMLAKLGIKDFGEARMKMINKNSLAEIFEVTKEELEPIIGPMNAYKFIQRMEELQTQPIYDYQMVGALGFTGMAIETWKKIFDKITLQDFYDLYCNGGLQIALRSIKGIGPIGINIIMDELPFYENDILTIINMDNIIDSKGLFSNQKSIRVSGFRDPELMQTLIDMGYDASDKSVTRTTDILIIPYEGYTSSKLNKIGENTIVVTKDDFANDMNLYLSKIRN